MADAYTDSLRVVLQVNGENAGTWGDNVDLALQMLEDSIADVRSIAQTTTSITLSTNNNADDQARAAVLDFSGSPTGTCTVTIPDKDKVYLISNGCDEILTFTKGSGTTYSINPGEKHLVYCKGGTGVFAITGGQKYVNTDAGAAAGPIITLYRNSASAAPSDVLGQLIFSGNDDQPVEVKYASIQVTALDETTTTEDGRLTISTAVAATDTLTENMHFGAGMYVEGNADPGAGKIDADEFLESGTDINPIGKQTMWVPATAMSPSVTAGCAALVPVETTAGQPDMQVLDFSDTTEEHAQFSVAFPKSWNLGTVTFMAFSTKSAAPTAGKDGVAWGLQGLSVGDDDSIDQAYGTEVVVGKDDAQTAEDLWVTAESGAVTIAGTPADDDLCFFQVSRVVASVSPLDDYDKDARLLGIKIFFTTDAATDT